MKTPLELLHSLTRIRMVEESIADRYHEQEMRCPVHLSIGQESAAVGVTAALEQSDWVFSGHRNHAHYLAKGGNLDSMIAEIYGKGTGCCGGKGGSMHLSDLKSGFIGATPIVASTIPIAAGAALRAKFEGKKRVVVVFLGDGAMEAGVVSETFNFAAVKKLPILFVCENNLYSVYSPLSVRQPEERSLSAFAAAHQISTKCLLSDDVEEIYDAAVTAVSHIRESAHPYFLEIPTYRWREHCGPNFDNNIGYREEKEYTEWKAKDPIQRLEKRHSIFLDEKEIANINSEIQQAFEKATRASYPSSYKAGEYVYPEQFQYSTSLPPSDRRISFAHAIREAQAISINRDANTYLMGLGVPDPKGIFGSTAGLAESYGSERIFDIPLSEHCLTGVAVGSSITGMRAILTHQRVDFALVSIDQIVNQAAKWYYMFNGQMCVPIVIRMIIGRGWGQGPQHSQSLHAWFGHIPGLRVILPSSASTAKGLLLSAIRDNSPVIFMEHRWLYDIEDVVPEDEYFLPLDKANVLRAGTDVTIIGLSYLTLECLKASESLESLGISCEVIDLISARPIDKATIAKSVMKTGRLVIVDQADSACSVAAEISAIAMEECFASLKVSPVRVTLPDHPAPTSPSLAMRYYPTSNDIIKTVCKMLCIDQSPANNEIGWGDQPSKEFCGPF